MVEWLCGGNARARNQSFDRLERRLAPLARVSLWVILVFSASHVFPRAVHASVVAEYSGGHTESTETTETFPFVIKDVQREYGISVTAILESGDGLLRVLDPAGTQIYQHLWGTMLSQERAPLAVTAPGTYSMVVSVEDARGDWRARVVALPATSALKWMYVSAALLIMLPLVAVGIAVRRGSGFRFVALGAAMFLAARVVWFIGAIAIDIAARFALEDAMPYLAFLWVQSAVLGLWQGIAATIGVVLVTRLAKSICEPPSRVIAAGIGSGALEMIAIGVLSLFGLAIMFGSGSKSGKARFLQAYDMAVTPILPLAEPAVLALTALCGVAATLLTVYGLRSRRFGHVVGGAALFAAVLTAVSASRSVTLFGPESKWVTVAVLLPLAGLAGALIRRNLLDWVDSPRAGETALDAFVREHEGSDN